MCSSNILGIAPINNFNSSLGKLVTFMISSILRKAWSVGGRNYRYIFIQSQIGGSMIKLYTYFAYLRFFWPTLEYLKSNSTIC